MRWTKRFISSITDCAPPMDAGQVGGHEGRIQFARQRLSGRLGNIAENEPNAFGGKRPCNASGDPGCRAGDECGVAVKQSQFRFSRTDKAIYRYSIALRSIQANIQTHNKLWKRSGRKWKS